MAYSREFLVCAFADKYRPVFKTEDEFFDFKIRMGYDFFDEVGRNVFRERCSLDPAAIKKYKESLK